MWRFLLHIVLIVQIALALNPAASFAEALGELSCDAGTEATCTEETEAHHSDDCTDTEESHSPSGEHNDADHCVHFCHCCLTALPGIPMSAADQIRITSPRRCTWSDPTTTAPPLPIDHPPC